MASAWRPGCLIIPDRVEGYPFWLIIVLQFFFWILAYFCGDKAGAEAEQPQGRCLSRTALLKY